MDESTLTIDPCEARASLVGASASLAEAWVGEFLSGLADSIDFVFTRAGGVQAGFAVSDRNLSGHARLVSGCASTRYTRSQLLRDMADQIDFADDLCGQARFEAALSDELGGAIAIASLRYLLQIAGREICDEK